MNKHNIPIPKGLNYSYIGIPFYKLLCNCPSITDLEYQLLLNESTHKSDAQLKAFSKTMLREILITRSLEITFMNLKPKQPNLKDWHEYYRKALKNIKSSVDSILSNEDSLSLRSTITNLNLTNIL